MTKPQVVGRQNGRRMSYMNNEHPPQDDQPAQPRPKREVIRIADSDGCSGPLPGWIEVLVEEYQQLLVDAERLLPFTHAYDHAPDLEDSSSRQEFLRSIGVRFGGDYVEREGCSSYDWDAYVYADEVDELIAAQDANLEQLRKDLLADATATLIPSHLLHSDKVEILHRLQLAKDPAFVRRVEQDDAEASEADELRAELEEKEGQLTTKDEIIEELEAEVRRRYTLRREAVAKALADVERYEALALSLQVRFGIIINGPLLTTRDGSRYLLTSIFGLELKDWPPGQELLTWDAVTSGSIQEVRISNTHLRGWKPPIAVDAEWIKRYYTRPHEWSRAWWFYFVFFRDHKLRLSTDTELNLGLSPEDVEALKTIGFASWKRD